VDFVLIAILENLHLILNKNTSLEVLCLSGLAMESDPWGGVKPEHKSLESSIEGTVASPQGAFDGQIIMLQPPSSASKIIGICCIIFGAFNIISLLGLLFIPQVDPITNEEISVSTSSFVATVFLTGTGAFVIIFAQELLIFLTVQVQLYKWNRIFIYEINEISIKVLATIIDI